MAKLASVVWKLGIQLQQMQNAFSLVQKKRESKKKKKGHEMNSEQIS